MAGAARTEDAPSLVVLAGGMGSRFGGLKQMVEVAAGGAVIMDILVRRAAAAGLSRAVIVVAPGMEEPVRAHLDAVGSALPVELAVQQAVPGYARPLGTAHAVLAARDALPAAPGAGPGTFVVVNADDLYPEAAFSRLHAHVRAAPDDEHAMVAFRVARTLTGTRPVSRALLEVDQAEALVAIREGTVVQGADGLCFELGDSVQALRGHEPVSMNMWAFRASVFDALEAAVADFVAEPHGGEALLTDVVASMIRDGAVIRVLVSDDACLGVTYNEDVAVVRAALS